MLGRATKEVDFIQHGSNRAVLHIELKRGEGDAVNPIVSRVIAKEGKSDFRLDGRKITVKDLKARLAEWNIQCDNLWFALSFFW